MKLRVFDAAMAAAWAMDEAALRGLLEIAAREHDVTPQALEAYRAKSLAGAERAKERGGVAILSVAGPLFKRANLMTEMCGATSYETLMLDFRAALDNGDVHSILLNVDSPGGEAAGVAEFAGAIRAAKGQKPIVAYAGDQAASAAYWIASAADRIVIGASAGLGSIGVRAAFADTSERDAARGVKTVEFVSSQSPYKKADLATDEGRGRIQARVDALAQVFVEAVAENRGVSVAQVLDGFGKGDVLIGKAAVSAGMADEIGTFESTLAGLSAREPRFAIGGHTFGATGAPSQETMTMTPEQIAAQEAEAAAAQAAAEAAAAEQATAEAAAAQAAEEAAAAAAAAAAADPAAAAVAADRQRVQAIMGLTLAGYEKERDEAILSGSSAGDFAALIVGAEKRKGTQRAAAVTEDTEANASIRQVQAAPTATGDDAAVKAILAATAAARGIK